MSRPPTLPSDVPVSDRDRSVIYVSILIELFLAALDQTIVATALPMIVQDLQGVERYAWVATSYLLASTALALVYGKLADTYPRKYVVLGAMILFLAGSMLCGLSGEFGELPVLGDGMSQLILFRGIQGAGGGGLFAMTFIVIADLFTPAERGKYQGFVGAVFGIASVLGPVIGGLLTDHAGGIIPGVEGWRWVFYVNAPVGGVALWFIVRRMPRLEPAGETLRPDVVSGAMLLGGLIPLILSLQLDKRRYPWLPGLASSDGGAGWESWLTLALFSASLVILGGFVRRSRRAASPILDLTLFENRVFRTANSATFFFGAAFMAVTIFLPLFLVNVLGVSATRAGAALIPFSMGIVFGATLAGQLVTRVGYRVQLLVGGVAFLAALIALARMDVDVAYGAVTFYLIVAGLGVGPAMPLFTLAIQNAVDVRFVGQATSASQFFRQIGATVGAAVMGTVLATTLGAAFSTLEVPVRVTAAPGSSLEQLVSTGGVELPDRIRAAYGELAADVTSAVRSGNPGELSHLVGDLDLPSQMRAPLAGARRGITDLDEASTERLAAELASYLEEHGERVAASVGGEIREAFTRATTRIYLLTAVILALGLVLTAGVPELPLRRTHDRAEAVKGS